MSRKNVLILSGIAAVIIILFGVVRPVKKKRDERRAESIYKRAVSFMERENFREALNGFRTIIKKYSRSKYYEPSFRKVIDIENDRYYNRAEAVLLAKKYYKKFPATDYTARALYVIAHNSHFFMSNDKEAGRYSGILLEKYGNSPDMEKLYTVLSDIAARAGDYSGVIKYNNLLLEKYPGKIDADNYLLNNVETYYRLGRIDEAFREIQKIKDKNKPNVKNSLPYHFVLLAKKPSAEVNLQISKIYTGMGMKGKADYYASQAKKPAGRK